MSSRGAFAFIAASTLAALAALLFTATPASATSYGTLKVSTSGTGVGYIEGPEISCGNGAEICEAMEESEASITLRAIPTERSRFTAWTGCQSVPSVRECVVRVAALGETHVNAEFTAIPQVTLTVANPGSGAGGGFIRAFGPGFEFPNIRCGDEEESCQGEYNEGTSLTLEASPNERSTFSGWTGCTVSKGTECRVRLTAATEVTAKLAPIPQQELTVATKGVGEGTVTTSPGSEFVAINCGTGAEVCEAEYNEGAAVALTANRATHSRFVGWSGPGAGSCTVEPTCEVQMSEARAIEAEFVPIPQQTLEVEVEGPGELNSSPAGISACTSSGGTCTEHFDSEGPESVVTLYASPGFNHHVLWSGCERQSGNECTVTMSTATKVKAEFVQTFHKLTVVGVGPGTITSAPAGISCSQGACEVAFAEGSYVTLTAHPGLHSQFLGWGAGQCFEEPTPAECEVPITEAMEVRGEFGPIFHTLSVAVGDGGKVSAATGAISACAKEGGVCSGAYPEASTVLLSAAPYPHSAFGGWGAGECKSEPEGKCEIEIGSSDETVHARFLPNTQTLTINASGPGSVSATSGPIKGCGSSDGVCSGAYVEAATAILTAEPDPHQAVAWSGCTTVDGDTCEVEIGPADASVQASFAQITDALTLRRAGTGSGSIACNGLPCAAAYPEGSSLTLIATPAQGSTFAGWSGAGCSGTGACKVTLEADTSLTATFSTKPPPPAEEKCVVPHLVRKTLGQARSVLGAAHCALGTVTKAKPKQHHKLGSLVVKSSSPPAGTTLPAGNKVNLTLGSKPKKKGSE